MNPSETPSSDGTLKLGNHVMVPAHLFEKMAACFYGLGPRAHRLLEESTLDPTPRASPAPPPHPLEGVSLGNAPVQAIIQSRSRFIPKGTATPEDLD